MKFTKIGTFIIMSCLLAGCGNSFKSAMERNGFRTQEEQDFLCISLMGYAGQRAGQVSVILSLAYSRYLQDKQQGNNAGTITEEHASYFSKAAAVFPTIPQKDQSIILNGCGERIKEIYADPTVKKYITDYTID